MNKEQLQQLAEDFLPDHETCDVMDVDELNKILADRRRQLVKFAEYVEERKKKHEGQ